MDLATTNAYALPGNLTANIQHGSWSMPVESGKAPNPSFLSSNQRSVYDDLKYSKKDIEHVEEWVKRHVETTWHSLGVSFPSAPLRLQFFFSTGDGKRTGVSLADLYKTCSMAPKEGNSIVKYGVLDERLNVHGVKHLKVADLSICPDNVGCNTCEYTHSIIDYLESMTDSYDRLYCSAYW